MVARQAPEIPQSLIDVSNDPVPPYEEIQGGVSGWQMVEHNDNVSIPREENLIDFGPEHDGPGKPGRKAEEPVSKILSDKDIVIAVMGVTGAGKSTFVSNLTDETVTVGHDLEACTTEPGMYNYNYKGRLIRLVDTPGFDDTNRSDTDILQDIAFFLSALHASKVKLAGIVYLHRITDPRMTGTAVKNLQLLQKLCGVEGLQKVVLVSTMWNLLTDTENGGSPDGLKVGEEREEMLKDKFWGDMIRKGSVVARHYGDKSSGDGILENILRDRVNGLAGNSDVVLQIQRELVDRKLGLPQTAAGQFLQKNLLDASKKFEEEIRDCEQELEEAKRAKDEELVKELEKQQREFEEKLGTCNSKTAELQVDFQTMAKKNEVLSDPGKRSDDIRLIEQNLAELQDAMERQEKDHRAEIARIMRSQRANTVGATDLIMQQKQMFEAQNQELKLKIAKMRLERESEIRRQKKKKKSGGGFGKFFDSFFGVFNEGDDRVVRGQERHYNQYEGDYEGVYDNMHNGGFGDGSRHRHQMQERRYR